jgi:putative oxidoreductase
MELGLLVLRSTIGLTLAAHGAQKLFGWWGGYGLEGTGKGLEMLGFYPGKRHALAAGTIELVAGLLLILGLGTVLGATLAASIMIVAAVTAHVRNGFFITSGGYEYNLVLGVAALSLAFTGAGSLSLDALFGLSAEGVVWGTAALLIAVVGATLQLAQRRLPEVSEAPTTA